MSVPAWLNALNVPGGCVSTQTAVHEHKSSFTVQLAQGDELWCIRVDNCWFRGAQSGKRVDYLFWGRSAAGRRVVFLVELKGSDYGHALGQVRATLENLCKFGPHDQIHSGAHRSSPGHDPVRQCGGVRAYVVLRNGRDVQLRQNETRRIQKQFGVIVYPYARYLKVAGLDSLLEMRDQDR